MKNPYTVLIIGLAAVAAVALLPNPTIGKPNSTTAVRTVWVDGKWYQVNYTYDPAAPVFRPAVMGKVHDHHPCTILIYCEGSQIGHEIGGVYTEGGCIDDNPETIVKSQLPGFRWDGQKYVKNATDSSLESIHTLVRTNGSKTVTNTTREIPIADGVLVRFSDGTWVQYNPGSLKVITGPKTDVTIRYGGAK